MDRKSKTVWDAKASVAMNSSSRLPELVGYYFSSGRALLAEPLSPEGLHAFRLETKRLRYTLELFRASYGPSLSNRLGDLQKLQQLLGEINDCFAAQKLLPRISSFLEDLGARRTTAFVTHWRDVFDTPGAQRRWEIYLRRPKKAISSPSRRRRASGRSR